MSDNKTLITTYIEAVGAGRLDEVATHLSPAVTFSGPGMPVISGSDGFITALERLQPIIARNEIKSVLIDGDQACVLYDLVTDTPVGPVVSAEWLTIDNGQIKSTYLLFDKARWTEVLEHLKLRAQAPDPR